MTDRQEAALLALLGDLCASDDAESFASRWGLTEPSHRRPSGVRVVCDPDGPFDSLEIRPWTDEVTGVVDVEMREGEPALVWPDVRDRFGPFRQLPGLHRPGDYAATWAMPDAAADALLLVGVAGDRVDTIAIRRDPH